MSYRIDNRVLLGALPTPTQVKELCSRERICAVVNLCAEFPGYKSLYQELALEQVRLPTSDFTIPSLETVEKGVEAMMRILEEREGSIYLHCKGK